MDYPPDAQVESAETLSELAEKIGVRREQGWIPLDEPREVRVQVGPKLTVRRFVVRFQQAPKPTAAKTAKPIVVHKIPARTAATSPVLTGE
jgi:hypothetical protein